MINRNGNFPNLDGIENGGLSGLSAQCLMVDFNVALFVCLFICLFVCLFVCGRPAVSRGSKAPPKVRQLDRPRDSGKKRRNQAVQVGIHTVHTVTHHVLQDGNSLPL